MNVFAYWPFLILLAIVCNGCTDTRVKRYSDILEPHIGKSRARQITPLLGNPASCKPEGSYEVCEYRTSAGRNEQVPFPHRKWDGLGPDLSPYEHYDVVQLYYDDFGVLRDWRPVVLPNPQ